jgi:hypothetical protein
MVKYVQGFFKPLNPQKYEGDPTNIVARSSWEYRVMNMLDRHPDVISWGSEELIIPYFDLSSGKNRRYFPDFLFTKKDGTRYLVEVKPYKQTIPPVKRKNQKTTSFLNEVSTWGTNSSKWSAAKAYCKKRGWGFIIITENDIPGLKK